MIWDFNESSLKFMDVNRISWTLMGFHRDADGIYDGLPAVFMFSRFRSLLNVTMIGDVSNIIGFPTIGDMMLEIIPIITLK